MQRKINMLLLLLSLLGGAVGFLIGELVIARLSDQLPDAVVTGIYLGNLALWIGLFCLIAEMIQPVLNGQSWRQRYTGLSWKLLVPATLVMLFAAGAILEWGYGLHLGGAKQVKDIVLAIDNSGSMQETDPEEERYKAAAQLITQMDSDKRVAVVEFHDQAQVIQPFELMKSQAVKEEVIARIDALEPTSAGTDIALALSETMSQIQKQSDQNRGTLVILLSDGFSDIDTTQVLEQYIQQGIVVHTVGLSQVNAAGAGLLTEIAQRTGGEYYDVQEADKLSQVFQRIYDRIGDRTLLTERTGVLQDSTYYMIYRLVAFAIIGLLIGLSLGIVFDNRFLARSFTFGGVASGILAGVVMEFGLSGAAFSDTIIRLFACLILAGITPLFTLVVPISENGHVSVRTRRGQSTAGPLGRGNSQRNSKGF